MIRNTCIFLLLFLTTFRLSASDAPDEGMWLPLYLKQYNEKDMQKLGMKITADDIYSINHSSIKDAVMRMGTGFCTAEIVSSNGLLFTNHHCGYEKIAEHSTLDHDYLKNGFWAKNYGEEIPNPGLTVSRLVYMQDLTPLFRNATDNIKDKDLRKMKQDMIGDSVKKAATAGTQYDAEVVSYFEGNEHYLLVYETFRDVRLVGAPPSAIGKFGGDVDNWMWPRHTGDFSVFRIYVGKDGKPADYSPDNVPYHPLHFFSISLKGEKKGDYSMVMGYPGHTERYLTSYDVIYDRDIQNPTLIQYLGNQLDVMHKDMMADPKLNLKLASDYASLNNSYKYYLGQERLLKTPDPAADVVKIKQDQEAELNKWISENPDRQKKYGSLLNDIRDELNSKRSFEPSYSLVVNTMFTEPVVNYAINYYEFSKLYANEKAKPSQADIDSAVAHVKGKAGEYIRSDRFVTDRHLLEGGLVMLFQQVPEASLPDFMKDIKKKYKGSNEDAAHAYVDDMYKKSFLLDSVKTAKWLRKPDYNKLKKDPLYSFTMDVISFYFSQGMANQTISRQLNEQHKLYMEALREWQPNKTFYPDANSTMRLTYGSVKPYFPRDGVSYNYYTTYLGILEKADPKDPEFQVPERELQLLKNKQWGRYAENDTLRICFLTNNDITGGNSGSPVLDANGNLIGLAFDGDWESMIGDMYINPKVNRTICVDIRYVLWVMDVYAGAKNLVNELNIKE